VSNPQRTEALLQHFGLVSRVLSDVMGWTLTCWAEVELTGSMRELVILGRGREWGWKFRNYH
jgi:hypothetical protein